MANYWISLRIKNDSSYDERYNDFVAALHAVKANGYWPETTAFWIIESNLAIDPFVKAITKPLDGKKDMVLVRKIAHDESRYFGAIEYPDVLKSFIPNIQKAA
ncbi:hypothetical protein HQ945_21750 [Phyllobacterium sp. BT25]|uniref:Uncharacterized protein n=1 Tax=Phyllobacterium pellucidum TaxID=2740464 RepID=A0A849VV77_9HYPH|nr:hypothetical protein [Phyllobacterium pellucidum]NTS33888.1 hypothetical protein [Phyllobacterium pellucidum]